MVRRLALGLPLFMGCVDNVGIQGLNMSDYFPFDGQRQWEYIQDDITLTYVLIATLSPDEETVDGKRVFTVDYEKRCLSNDPECPDGEWVRSLRLSSDSIDGTLFYSVDTPEGETTFDPPLKFTEGRMLIGDSVSTETAGSNWTATLENVEQCPVRWDVDWPDCVHIVLEGPSSSPLVGDWWAVTNFNIVSFDIGGEGHWQLKDAEYCADGDEDCPI